MKIVVHSFTFRATVINDETPEKTEQIERTFAPGEKGLPGCFNDVFGLIRFYLFHNPDQAAHSEERSPATKNPRTGGACGLYE